MGPNIGGVWLDVHRLHMTSECGLHGGFHFFEASTCCLMHARQFFKSTDSLWFTAGTSCRTLSVGLLAGDFSLAQFICKAKATCTPHLNGIKKLEDKHRAFVAMAGLVSIPRYRRLTSLLNDDGVAANIATYRDNARTRAFFR